MRLPLAAPLAAVSGGVFAARFADFSTLNVVLAALFACALAGWGLRAPSMWAGEAAGLLGLALCGAWLHDVAAAPRPCGAVQVLERMEVDLADPVRLRGWVKRPPEALGDADRFDLELDAILRDVPACGGVRLTVYREADGPRLRMSYGTHVELLARLREPRNYRNSGAFDRVSYLRDRGSR